MFSSYFYQIPLGCLPEDPLLVVARELVKAGAPDRRLVGEVPGAQLVAHLMLPGDVCDASSLWVLKPGS